MKRMGDPWTLGEGGSRVGKLPVRCGEGKGKTQNCIRRYWKGDDGVLAEFAYRFTGSPDLYQHQGKAPWASVNFVTVHDGFTLNDLVSYNDKHNEANGEDNRDGDSHNNSWNCGAEGPTDDVKINQLRERQKRNFLSTLFLSQGVPLLNGGDEFSRTQKGNNNTYCHNNDLTCFTCHWTPS